MIPKQKKILFVCTQNVFRSLSAQKLLEKHLIERKDERFQVYSAGTEAYPDRPYNYTLQKLKELAVMPFSHQQTRVSQEVLDDTAIVICMTKAHQNFLKKNFNRDSYLFNELGYGKKTDLEDDVETSIFGQNNLETFVRNTIEKIHKAIPRLYSFLNT